MLVQKGTLMPCREKSSVREGRALCAHRSRCRWSLGLRLRSCNQGHQAACMDGQAGPYLFLGHCKDRGTGSHRKWGRHVINRNGMPSRALTRHGR